MTITRKYIIYWSRLGTGIRWPVAWGMPTATETIILIVAILFAVAAVVVLMRCAFRG